MAVPITAPAEPHPRETLSAPAAPRGTSAGRWWLRLVAVLGLAAAAEVLAPWHLGWTATVAALGLSVTSMVGWGPTVLDRLVPLLWAWIAALVVLGWLLPFAPWAAGAWLTTALAAVPFAACGRTRPARRVRRSVSAREWAAAVLPVGLLSLPFALHRDLAGTITQLGFGWDTVNHLTVLRGALLSPGVTVLGPEPDRLLNPGLLGYPSGAHQVWAAWGRTLGLPGDGTSDVVAAYPVLVAATWLVLALTLVWAYRRLAPWGRRRALPDVLALALVACCLGVAPLPGLWISGFHNFALAAAGLALLAGVAATAAGGPRTGIWVATAALVVVATTYPLLAPIAGVGWLVVAVLVLRARRRPALATVLGAALVGAVCLFPAAVPYLDPASSPAFSTVTSTTDLISVKGGLAVIPVLTPLLLVLLVLFGTALWRPYRVRALRAAWVPAAALGVVVAVGFLTMTRGGIVGYYADKALYAAIVAVLPLSAAGLAAAVLAVGTMRRSAVRPAARPVVVCSGLGAALVAAGLAVSGLPHDPLGVTDGLPGVHHLQRALGADPPSFVAGDRVVALRDAATRANQIVVPSDVLLGTVRVVPAAFTNEQNWMALLNGVDVSGARLLANLDPVPSTPVGRFACVLATFTRNHPKDQLLLLVDTPEQQAAAQQGLGSCTTQPSAGVDVAVAALPDPIAFMLAPRSP